MMGMASAAPSEDLFEGRPFHQEIVILCVRRYLQYKLSTRNLVEMMAERGVVLAHMAILCRVPRYAPALEKHWNQYALRVSDSWRCDGTYVKAKGRWTYLYRFVDAYLSARDVNAAKHFFHRAIKSTGAPRVITLDAYATSHRAARELKAEGWLPQRVRLRLSKFLSNKVEQGYRRIKQRIKPMLGFKRFEHAAVTISGIELVQKIHKEQFEIQKPGSPSVTTPELWRAVLAT
jgi:transposase-like protein